ncbi:hypothetical protein C6503_08915 [Candidatus Poribacteria bacterium]|nr:MAG: hypothetical protein C6503_08915 [Candidatus Poribacteria bacterium]
MRKTQNLRDLLTELTRSHDFEPKMLEQKVFALWREHLGTPLGTKTVPVSLSDSVLKVYTEYPPFKKELLLLKERIIEDLNVELGEIVLTDLRIEIRQVHKASSYHANNAPTDPEMSKTTTSTPESSNLRTPTPKELEQIEQAITDVTDTDLKTSLRQLFMTQSKEKP